MTKPKQILKPSKDSQEMAMFLAMVVRNAMEDFHHRHLSDEQMKALNPIIRNAVQTGLQALRHSDRSEGAAVIRRLPEYAHSELLATAGVADRLCGARQDDERWKRK